VQRRGFLVSAPWAWALSHFDVRGKPPARGLPLPPSGGATQSLPGVAEVQDTTQAQPYVPVSQSFALANDTYEDIVQWTVTGQTDDPLPGFGLTAGSQTYQTSGHGPIQGPAFWFGSNTQLLSAQVGSAAHGAVGSSCFGDAGDSYNGSGGHDLEFNPACFRSADGSAATNALEMVAVDDNTNTVSLAIRCGTGAGSAIVLQKADASIDYLLAGPAYGDVLECPVPFTLSGSTFTHSVTSGNTSWQVSNTAGTALTFTFQATAPSAWNVFTIGSAGLGGVAQLIIGGNSPSGVGASLAFQHAAGRPAWAIEEVGGQYLYINNNSGYPQILLASGSNAAPHFDNAVTYLTCKTLAYGSLVVGPGAALAVSAATGFLYLPTCAGAPTGTPEDNSGSAATVYDTANEKIWFYHGSWKGVTVA
jgi:hypothetical protein